MSMRISSRVDEEDADAARAWAARLGIDPSELLRAALRRHLDGVPTACMVNFDNVHTLHRGQFRRRVTILSPARLAQACRTLAAATG